MDHSSIREPLALVSCRRTSRSAICNIRMQLRTLIMIVSALTLPACTFNHAKYVKQMTKLEAAEYSKIKVGEVQNFTAVKLRVFDRQRQVELSNADDPEIQAQFSNQGDVVYYGDNTSGQVFRFVARPIPSDMHGDWDRFAVLDGSSHANATNYVSMVGQKDFFANIVDNDPTLHYKDAAIDIVLRRRLLPTGTHADFDAFFVTDDDRYGIFRSSSRAIYRFSFIDADTREPHIFEFRPAGWGLQSTKYGSYRGVGYVPKLQEWFVHDFLPTQKLICFDLARAYEATAKAADRAVSQAVLRVIVMALGGYSTATFSGVGQSTYAGYYTGRSTTNYTGYAQVYDYRYLAAGAVSYT